MNVDRLVEQAREQLEPFGDVRHFDVLVPTDLLAGLADAVEQLQTERAALLENLRARDRRAHRELSEGRE